MKYFPLLMALLMVSSASLAQIGSGTQPGPSHGTAEASTAPVTTHTPPAHRETGTMAPYAPAATDTTTAPLTTPTVVRDDAPRTGAGTYIADPSGKVLPTNDEVTTPAAVLHSLPVSVNDRQTTPGAY